MLIPMASLLSLTPAAVDDNQNPAPVSARVSRTVEQYGDGAGSLNQSGFDYV